MTPPSGGRALIRVKNRESERPSVAARVGAVVETRAVTHEGDVSRPQQDFTYVHSRRPAPALILPAPDTAPRREQRTMRRSARRHQPTERHRWPQRTSSAEPGASGWGRRIEVVSALTARWGLLDARVRRPVEDLFEGAPAASGVTFAVDGDLPLEFVRDLICGGGALRDAPTPPLPSLATSRHPWK